MEIRLFVREDGQSGPFEQWLAGLRDTVTRGRILARLNRVRLGNFGDAKSPGQSLWELRLDLGPGYRVYFGRDGREIIVLLCGGDKSTQRRDIAIAREYWRIYKERQHE